MKIKRREFIKKSAIGAGGIMLGARLASAQEPVSKPDVKYHDPYAPVKLGNTDLKVHARDDGHRQPWERA